MYPAVFVPAQPRHLCYFLVDVKALGFKGFGGLGGQFQRQLPSKQALTFGFGFEGFMQPFGAVVCQGFALGLCGQRVQGLEFYGNIGVFVEESVQCQLVVIAGW